MIRELIHRLNNWYNSRGSWTQMGVLFGFCVTFLITLWLAITCIRFDAKQFDTKIPVSIGKASGPAMIHPEPKNNK
ncbi:hypothetical protein INP83_06900 [Mucilaginibacter sp. 21P]|uniref:hypothetical protein n=1 Tax=Mucilaginibacter sp. 21P TaxID=2778902 RepID=UPI001C56AD89|nr:hypothetical protein [Mucilaginibacter sp. 21P]QXV66806.1 hypothetical protein INP83_06900 [Mucilaginibacter sp. 21P]